MSLQVAISGNKVNRKTLVPHMMLSGDEQVQACAGSSSHEFSEVRDGEIQRLSLGFDNLKLP